jgi:hypothetical protein
VATKARCATRGVAAGRVDDIAAGCGGIVFGVVLALDADAGVLAGEATGCSEDAEVRRGVEIVAVLDALLQLQRGVEGGAIGPDADRAVGVAQLNLRIDSARSVSGPPRWCCR